MQKIVLAISFSLLFAQAFSQDYRSVLINDTSYFEYLVDDYYFFPMFNKKTQTSVWIDSVSVTPGSEQLYNYVSFDRINDCLFSTRSSFLGTSCLRRQDGYDIFYNESGDSVSVFTQSGTGYTWNFYHYPNGDFLEATITTVTDTSFLGLTDSIKVISLQTKNSSGLNIAGFYNWKTICLSKSRGLIRTFGFRYFPEDTTIYKLSGISGLTNGYHHLTASGIYDFDVGDEFHYHNLWSAAIPSRDEYFIEKRILSKSFSSSQDSVIYEYDNNFYHKSTDFGNVTVTLAHDTLVESYPISADEFISGLPNQYYAFDPFQPFARYGYTIPFSDTTYFLRSRKFTEDFYTEQGIPGQFCYPVGLGIFPQRIFAYGLGEIYETDPSLLMRFDSLVYYKKGNEEWGTRLNWSEILNISEYENVENRVFVYPNPVVRDATISLSGVEYGTRVTIYNTSGSGIMTFRLTGKETTVDLSDLKNGLYTGVIDVTNATRVFRIMKLE